LDFLPKSKLLQPLKWSGFLKGLKSFKGVFQRGPVFKTPPKGGRGELEEFFPKMFLLNRGEGWAIYFPRGDIKGRLPPRESTYLWGPNSGGDHSSSV